MLSAWLVAPGAALAQTEWVDDPVNPVVPAPDPGAWDGWRHLTSVILVDGTYHMYFEGQEAESAGYDNCEIGHATSIDGVEWTMDPANPVLVRGDGGEWDSGTAGSAVVINDGTGFRMWYRGGREGESGLPVGYATSPDGSSWTKHAGNPIMVPGPAGAFDDASISPGTVLFDGSVYRMWYAATRAGDDFRDKIGYAQSDDGLSWTRRSEPVTGLDEGWESDMEVSPSVVFDGSVYRMWYTGAVWMNWVNIGYAESRDGVDWTAYLGNPVFDGGIVFHGRVVHDDAGAGFQMWYQDYTDDSIRLATSTCCSNVYSSIIPAAAYAAGAEGSFYETDLDLNNADRGDVEYRFVWLPRGAGNGDPVQSAQFTLGAGRSVRYVNVLAEIFDLEPDAFGALRIDASSQDLHALVRIANTPHEPGAGSFGQAMASIRISDCAGMDERRRLLFGTENDAMRFNVGCLNASNLPARVNFELYRSDGTLLGMESMILMQWSNDQLNRIFDQYHPVAGYVEYWSDSPQGRIYCYGSALDNITSDPTTIPPM